MGIIPTSNLTNGEKANFLYSLKKKKKRTNNKNPPTIIKSNAQKRLGKTKKEKKKQNQKNPK